MSIKNYDPDGIYFLENNIQFQEVEPPYKYIFLRLYNPIYSNPFYYANILKGMIELTEITDYTASHAAIGFSLDDSFYGLSSPGNGTLKIEHCTDIYDNIYMKNCDPYNSDQLTLALKVRASEYDNIKEYVETSYLNPKLRYDVGINFSIGSIAVKRKFFSKSTNKEFGHVKYPKNRKKAMEAPENNFVCCTFIAYALINNVPEIKQWFIEREIDYSLLTVTDLLGLPNVVKLFYSNWNNYDLAANAFVKLHPEFSEYLNN